MNVLDDHDVTMMLNGVPMTARLTYDCAEPPAPRSGVYPVRSGGRLPPFAYEAHGELKIGGLYARRLIDAFTEAIIGRPPPGASEATLARRVAYGGRKGRSAMRRLWARGYVGILRVNDEPPVPCPPVTIGWDEP